MSKPIVCSGRTYECTSASFPDALALIDGPGATRPSWTTQTDIERQRVKQTGYRRFVHKIRQCASHGEELVPRVALMHVRSAYGAEVTAPHSVLLLSGLQRVICAVTIRQ